MKPRVEDVYEVLRGWAKGRGSGPRTYADLSRDYHALTGDWFEPHGSWDEPLGELNQRVHTRLGAPALSALVVLAPPVFEPGGAFWGCSPNVPPRPRTDLERIDEWSRIVREVQEWNWPTSLP